MLHNFFNFIPVTISAVLIPVQTQEMHTEDQSSDISSSYMPRPHSPPYPPSPTPPAIPARVALPSKQLSLFEIDYLSTHSDSSEITTPTSLSHDILPNSDMTSVVVDGTPTPHPLPNDHSTNSTQSNPEQHGECVRVVGSLPWPPRLHGNGRYCANCMGVGFLTHSLVE